MRGLTFAAFAIVLSSCTNPSGPANKFADPTLIKIYDLKDRRATDSLLRFLKSDIPLYRQEAALAFGSVQDSLASLALGQLLIEDADRVVRRYAAFALGQTGGQSLKSLISASHDSDPEVVREALVALGKTLSEQDRSALTGFESSDSLALEGQAWGLYHLMLRKKADSLATQRAAELLKPGYSYQTRLAAAHYFGRSSKLDAKNFEDGLIQAALSDQHAEVRMAAAAGLKHIGTARMLTTIKKLMQEESDYRVRVNAIRACQNSPDSTRSILFEGLKDSSVMVQIAASEAIRNSVPPAGERERMEDALLKAKFPRVRANLYAALLKGADANNTIKEIIKEYATADDYYKAQLLSALGEANSQRPDGKDAQEWVTKELLNDQVSRVVATSAATALTTLDGQERNPASKLSTLEVYKKAIHNGDPAVTGLICAALTDPVNDYRGIIHDTGFLHEARNKLTLPRDIESMQPIDEAIAFLEGKPKPAKPSNEFNHPIDWTLVSRIAVHQEAELITTRGSISIALVVEESPGSVCNFVSLAEKGYFNGKFVHRVVPNFVAQAGCNRGDGFGSEDYSIRSEFSVRRYATGAVGMASAGKDTEGTQWFITHCPTPHLDGRYSIFAFVVKGMDVVHQLQVGDQILEVRMPSSL